MENDPHELVNLIDNPEFEKVRAEFSALADAKWDLARFDEEVRRSQARRWIVYEALRNGEYYPWDYQPLKKASERFINSSFLSTKALGFFTLVNTTLGPQKTSSSKTTLS